jgi:hypothetical protein
LIFGFVFLGENPAESSYGWAVVEGPNPTELYANTLTQPINNSPYTWTATRAIGLDSPGRVIGRRWDQPSGVEIPAGTLFIHLEGPSETDLISLIDSSLVVLQTTIIGLDTRLDVAEVSLVSYGNQITSLELQDIALLAAIEREAQLRATQIAALQSVGIVDWQSVIDNSAIVLRAEFVAADEIIEIIANQALTLANALQVQLNSIDFVGLRAEFDALQDLVGVIDSRIKTEVRGEIPAGAIDGVNTIFTLANIPFDSVSLYWNGIRQSEGVGYTIVSDTITMTVALKVGATLVADYRF